MPQPLPPQAPAHWSKDFVEHLRTVHFALIAVSAGLILLVLSAREYNVVNALVQIEEIIDLKAQWKLGWILDHTTKTWYVRDGADKKCDTCKNEFDTDGRVFYGALIALSDQWVAKLKSRHTPQVFPYTLGFPSSNFITSDPSWSPDHFPRTLKEFEDWWSLMKTPQILEIPRQISEQPSSDGLFQGIDLPSNEELKRGYPKMPLSLVQDISNPRFNSQLRDPTYSFPIQTAERYVLSQDTVVSVFHNFQRGTFEESFADLSASARNEADLPLEEIRTFIHDEASKGTEVFEAFGMKFPANKVTLWGIFLILCVQLYFLVYLRQLSGKLRPDDPGWDVPWVGMDGTSVGQAIMFVSLVLLPIIAIVLLGYQAIRAKQLLSETLWVRRTEYAGLVIALIASICFGAFSWMYRPKLEPQEPPTPTPLFY